MKTALLTVLLAASTGTVSVSARDISLLLADWQPVAFDSIEPTLFQQIDTPDGEGVRMTVRNSSSFLVQPFTKVEEISRVSWKMRYSGLPPVANRSEESAKSGDDFVLRVGLITAGDHKRVSMFAPDWIKQLAKILKAPAGNVVYLVASRFHPSGSTWPSPYSDQLSYVSVVELKRESTRDWIEVAYTLPTPTRVIGLWLMADGDDTHATFTSAIRQLRIDALDSL